MQAAFKRVKVHGSLLPELSQEYIGVPGLLVLGSHVYFSAEANAAFIRRPSTNNRECWAVVRLGARSLEALVAEWRTVHCLVFDEFTASVEFGDSGEQLASQASVAAGEGCCRVVGAKRTELDGDYWQGAWPGWALHWADAPYWGPDGRGTHFLYTTRFGGFAVSPAERFALVHAQGDMGDILFGFQASAADQQDHGRIVERGWDGNWLEGGASYEPFEVLLRVTGASGPKAGLVNGYYRPTAEEPVFAKEGVGDQCLRFLVDKGLWIQQPTASGGKFVGSMYSTGDAAAAKLPSEVERWCVSIGGGRWEEQCVKVVQVSELEAKHCHELTVASGEVRDEEAVAKPEAAAPAAAPAADVAAGSSEPSAAAAGQGAAAAEKGRQRQEEQRQEERRAGGRPRAREAEAAEPREAVVRRRTDGVPDAPPEATVEELRRLVATWDSCTGGTNLQDAWQWYEKYLEQGDHAAVGLEPLRLRGLKSDFKVAYEVLGREGYRPPRAGPEFALFGLAPGDRVLDGGGNIGAYVHWAIRQGAGHVDVYEPAWFGSTFHQLKRNCSDPRVTLHNCGLGVATGTERLLDLESSRAGASRSTVEALNTYQGRTWLAGAELCEIQVVDFDEVLPGHQVVKMDMEGSELPILDTRHRWDVARVLHVEYSANRCRSDDGEPWRRFAESLKRLEEAAWTHVYIPHEVYKARFWAKGGGRGLDFNFWAFREEADPKWSERVDWKHLDMECLEDLRTKWLHFGTLVLDPAGFV